MIRFLVCLVCIALAGCARNLEPAQPTITAPSAAQTSAADGVLDQMGRELAADLMLRDQGLLQWADWGHRYGATIFANAQKAGMPPHVFERLATHVVSVARIADDVQLKLKSPDQARVEIGLLELSLGNDPTSAPAIPSAPSAATGAGYGYPSTVSVGGYFRRDGTYVAPHIRTRGNSTQFDNFSTRGNFNPFSGRTGSRAARR